MSSVEIQYKLKETNKRKFHIMLTKCLIKNFDKKLKLLFKKEKKRS